MAVAYSKSYELDVVENASQELPYLATVAIDDDAANLITLVGVTLYPGVGNEIAFDVVAVEGVTLGGDAMTYLMTVFKGGWTVDIYYKVGATGGSKDVVVTYNNPDIIYGVFTSSIVIGTYQGVDQSSPIVESTSATGLNRNPEGTLTSDSADNAIVDLTVISRGTTRFTLTEDGDGTNRKLNLVGSTGALHYGTLTDVVGSGAKTMSYNISGTTNKNWAMGLLELKAAADSTPLRMLMGIG